MSLGFGLCCCSGSPPNPSCSGQTCAYVYSKASGNAAVPGIAVVIYYGDPYATGTPTVSGTTDSSGKFCASPPNAGNVPYYVKFTSPLGATVTVPILVVGTTCTATVYYCDRKLVAYAYDGDNADPGPAGGIAATLGGIRGYGIGGQVADGSVVAASGVGVTTSGNATTFEEQSFYLGAADAFLPNSAAVAGAIPQYVAAYASGYYGYAGLCCPFSFSGGACVNCGDKASLPIPLFLQSKYVWNYKCDPGSIPDPYGCRSFNPRCLVTPKTLYATFTGPEPVFGADSGVSLTLHWDPRSWDGRYDHPPAQPPYSFQAHGGQIIAWISDCRASGSYGGCYIPSTHNCRTELAESGTPGNVYPDPYFLSKVLYGSRQIVLQGGGAPPTYIVYENFWTTDCTVSDPPVCYVYPGAPDAPPVKAQTFGFCKYHSGCAPYSTYPVPTGPTAFYPQIIGADLTEAPYSNQGFCSPITDASSSETVVIDDGPGCSYTITVHLTE